MSLQQTIGPVTRHAGAWPAPGPLAAEANVSHTKECSVKYLMYRGIGWLLSLITVFMLASCCSDDQSPDSQLVHSWDVQPGHLWPSDDYSICVPDTVGAGISFEVSVPTVLSGCDVQGPDQVLNVSDTITLIAPWDSIYTGTGICYMEVMPAIHRINLEFPSTGEALVVINVMQYLQAGGDSLVQSEHRVVVE